MEELQPTTAPSSNIGADIGQNIIPATRILQIRTNLGTALADAPESAARSLDKEKIPRVKRAKKGSTKDVVCRCNTAQRRADLDYLADHRTRPWQ